ncbi:membrane-spanning 4-domains subfamily A member 4D-like [Scleropages formosus]|uniref:Membrane-spanning 4-domains subfamily A member 4D-like n=1 Tax=Scleropages formosus TaxID=113540 RepID=A0A0P7VN21_SCLFO|nr:membrane-spanning 4-domains subfamily A member 4D-like [Scleropages formosus]
MEKTFKCDDCIIITIPLIRGRHGEVQQMPPEKFHCVFKDTYKVFLKGQPKALGTVQIVTALLIIGLGLLRTEDFALIALYTIPSILAKISFSLNIMSFFGAIVALVLCCILSMNPYALHRIYKLSAGIDVMIAIHLFLEIIIAVVLIFWESKAVCRNHFNILPLINFKYMEA